MTLLQQTLSVGLLLLGASCGRSTTFTLPDESVGGTEGRPKVTLMRNGELLVLERGGTPLELVTSRGTLLSDLAMTGDDRFVFAILNRGSRGSGWNPQSIARVAVDAAALVPDVLLDQARLHRELPGAYLASLDGVSETGDRLVLRIRVEQPKNRWVGRPYYFYTKEDRLEEILP